MTLTGQTEALRELAPDGTIRIALNIANAATVSVSDAGELDGPAPTLAKALGRWTGLPISITRFESAGAVIKSAKVGDAWDVAFLAVDPARADLFHFTPAYLTIEATIAVWAASTFQSLEELDCPGVQIATSEGAAYDLILQRTLRHASRVTFSNPPLSFSGFDQQRLDAVAGIRQMLEQATSGRNDIRILPGRIAAIEHAMAVPLSRKRGGMLLDSFVLHWRQEALLRAQTPSPHSTR